MSQKNIDRDDIATKLNIVNNIIRKGYDTVYYSIENTYKDYYLSIKNNNFFQLREDLLSKLTPLVHS